ncbi:MAG: tRNA guanosine(34) transglycosylase Tgt [Candidatus Cloacimonetes bacterium]|nr:tRNA guanosine(34) transglycosylase Tgt [Candidatus Cloacimonadota bacterium]
MIPITLKAQDSKSLARVTEFTLRGVKIETPQFMPVGTRGAVKTLDSADLQALGFPIILGNTYHLYLKPGIEVLREHGGLHNFTGFSGAMLTDSGGFQIFSLEGMRKLDEQGVTFQSVYDGSKHRFEPASVIQIQRAIGADIMMCLDECPPGDAPRSYIEKSMELTHRWAIQCVEEFTRDPGRQHLFGIFQGGVHQDLRERSLKFIQDLPFSGIAIGGLSVGESREDMSRVLQHVGPLMDPHRLHYLMGVGTPHDFLTAIECGVDLFDCVMPTRVARHGRAFTANGQVNLLNSRFRTQLSAIDSHCDCRICQNYSASYVHHLLKMKETTGQRLLTWHNLAFFKNFLKNAREAIGAGQFLEFRDHWLERL